MGSLYETISTLCENKGVSVSKMCTEIGISRGILSDLKTGRKSGVSAKTLNKIAEYFGVTMNYLMGTEKTATQQGGGHSPISEEIADFIDTLSPEEQRRAQNAIHAIYGGKPGNQ